MSDKEKVTFTLLYGTQEEQRKSTEKFEPSIESVGTKSSSGQ